MSACGSSSSTYVSVCKSKKTVESVLSYIVTSPECSVDSPRARSIKEGCKKLLDVFSQDDALTLNL